MQKSLSHIIVNNLVYSINIGIKTFLYNAAIIWNGMYPHSRRNTVFGRDFVAIPTENFCKLIYTFRILFFSKPINMKPVEIFGKYIHTDFDFSRRIQSLTVVFTQSTIFVIPPYAKRFPIKKTSFRLLKSAARRIFANFLKFLAYIVSVHIKLFCFISHRPLRAQNQGQNFFKNAQKVFYTFFAL